MEVERQWRHRRLTPALYDFVVERERIARPAGRLIWGADVGPLFESMAETVRLPPGSAVLDMPCGGGVAFRGLQPGADLRYVAADLSPVMLGRARAQARRRGLRVAFAEASVFGLPFGPGVFDLCVTYNGLHCLPDPAAAVAELARVLRPGGLLRGSTLVTGAGVRQDVLLALLRATGDFGRPGTEPDLHDWLAAAGLRDVVVRTSGAFAYFTAVKPD